MTGWYLRTRLKLRKEKKELAAAGYDYTAIQEILQAVIRGDLRTATVTPALRKIGADIPVSSSRSRAGGRSVGLAISDGAEGIYSDVFNAMIEGRVSLDEFKAFANKFNIALPEPVAETVSEPTQEVTEEEQVDIDDFFSDKEIDGVDKVDDNLVVNRKQLSEDKAETAQDERKISRIKQIAKKAAVSLKKQFPDVRIVLHETEGQYKRFAGKRARGAYVKDDKTKTIHINLSIADLSTVPHEVFHALLLEAAATDPQALVIARNMLESVRKVVDPNSEMSKAIEKFVAKYEDVPVIQDEEYLAELMGILSSQYRTLDKPSKNAIKEFLRKLAKLVGIDTKFGLDEFFGPEFLERDEQVIDLLNTISGKVSKGQFIEAADVKTMGDILAEATPAEQAQAQREVRDFKRKERERKATPRMQVVTEEDGKPVTFYHGTDKKFDKFEPQKSTRTILMSQYEVKTPAIFFTPDEAEAREYGDNIIPVNLQFEKLVEDNIDEAAQIITDYYVKEKDGVIEVQDGVVDLSDYYDEATDSYNNNWVKDVLDEAEGIDWMLLDEEALVEKFKEAGFDGTKVYEGDKAFSVATFYPENIVRLDQGVAPRQQIADAATSIQESLKFADKSSLPNKLEFKRALQERFDNEVYPLIKERYEVKDNRSNTDQGLKDYLVDAYLNETLTAIEAYPDALGWYDARITGAMSLMEKLHPELATDKDAASTFKIALAITSNGNKVYDNFVEANRQYEYFKENGKFDDSYSIGDQRAGILSTLAFTNKALESMSMADFTAFLTTKYRAGDLKYMKDGKKTPLLPGFAVDEEVYGASIFGPKIGNGFFMNLYGEFNQLTMDRWFMRQFGRLTGTLLDYDQKKVDAGTKRLNRATKALAKRNGAKLSDMIPGWDKMSAEELSNKIQKASMDLKKRAIFKSNPKLDEVRKAGNNLSKQVSAEVEAPRNSSQRKFINEVFTELQAKLKNDYDIDITIADLQAVNWYPEKALYQTFKADQSTKTGKVETSDNEQPDYESAAKKLVEEQGVSKKEIKEDEARRSKQLERNTANREAIEQRAGELNKDDIEASEVKRLKDKIISVKEDVTSSDLEEGVAPRQQVIEDVTAKELDTPLDRQQRVFRSGDLENKAEPRWKFRSSRETGHFGTGFYFFGTKEQADKYDARDVSELDIDKYNLAKATKELHQALRVINDRYNEYYTTEAVDELKKEPLRQAVPTFFIEEVAEAAGMDVISEAEAEAAATEVTKALTKDGNPAFGDSVSTLVMKALGFDGVNAVGTSLDNSKYGTVIYDLKEDVAPRQQKPYPSGPEEAAKMGYLVHASDKSRDSFDKKFIKGRNRTELGALGFYFTANAQKAKDYGGEYTYIDPADMNLLNLDEVKGNKLQGFLSDLERNLGKLSSYRMRLIAAQDKTRSISEFNELDAELKKVDAQIKAQSPFGTSASSQDRVLKALKKAKAKNLMEAYKVSEYAIESRLGGKSDTDAAFSDLLFNAGYDGIYEGPGLYKVAIFDIDGLNDAIVRDDVAPRQQVLYHVTVRDNKGSIQKKGLEKDRPPTFAKGVMGTAVFDTAGKSFAFSNLEDATKWGIKTKIEKDKEVSIVAVNAEGKNLQEDKAVTEGPVQSVAISGIH